MAEIQSNGGGGDGGKKRAKKQSTKVYSHFYFTKCFRIHSGFY